MLKLAVTLFPRLLRTKDFHLLLLALVVANCTVTAIHLFVERIDNTLDGEATSFIAADAKIQGSSAPDPSWRLRAHDLGLTTAHYQSFNVMLFAGEEMVLTRAKAVSDNYPLHGELSIGAPLSQELTVVKKGPQKGQVWLAPRLFSALNIKPGDAVQMGSATFIAKAALHKEPDNAQGMFGFAPRVMMHASDVKATKAIQLGSRVSYALLFSGEAQSIEHLKTQLENQLGEHHRWLSPEDGNAAFNNAFKRSQRFLLLAGCLSVILAGVAIALAAHRFAKEQQTQVALLKTFGVNPYRIQKLYILLLVAIGLLGFLLGAFMGWLLHYAILFLLGDLLPKHLAGAGFSTLWTSAGITALALFAFAAPPLLALKNTPPAKIFRQEPENSRIIYISALTGLLATAGLIGFYGRDFMLTGIVLGGLLSCIVVSYFFSKVLLAATYQLQTSLHGVWRIGLANLQRQRQMTALQIFVFANIGLLVLVLFQVRTSLIGDWQPRLANAPNHFVYNIFEDDLDSVKAVFEQESIAVTEYYPMFRGRLISVNGVVTKKKIIRDKQKSNYERELNLTWSQTYGRDNKVVQGQWWHDGDNRSLSVSAEQTYAEGLGLQIGDVLTFSIAGRKFDATLTNIRSVQWDSMNPNFYMIFNRAAVKGYGADWITSFYLPSEKKQFVNTLIKRFPTVSLIELDQTLTLIKSVVARVSMAVEFILLLVLVASVLILLTSIYVTLDERRRESALLRSFGAKRGFVQKILLIEFSSIGLIAGVFSCIGAQLCLYFIQVKIFDMPYVVHWMMLLCVPVFSAVLVGTIGYFATLGTTYLPPMRVLRFQV